MSFAENCSIRKIVKIILLSTFAISALFGIALAAGVTTVKITEDKTKPEEITTTTPGIGEDVELACDGSARIPVGSVLWEYSTSDSGEYSDWCIFIPTEPRSRVPYSAQCALFEAIPISLHDEDVQKAFESTRIEKNIEMIEFGGETNRRGEFSWFDGSPVDFMEAEISAGSGELYLDSDGWEVKSVARNASAHFACYVDLKSTTTSLPDSSSSTFSSSSSSTSSTIPSSSTSPTTLSTILTTRTTTEEIVLGWSYCDSDADKADILWTNTPLYDGANSLFKDWCVFIPHESRQIGVSQEVHCELFHARPLSIHDSKLQSAIELVLREHSEISMVSVGGQKQSRNEDFTWDDKTDTDYKERQLNGWNVGIGQLTYSRQMGLSGKWEYVSNEDETMNFAHFACYQKLPETEGSAENSQLEIIENFFDPLF